MDVLTKVDFDKICRCCLFSQEQEMVLFNAWHQEIYCAITSLQFNNEDKRSKLICQQCTAKMKIVKDFSEVCIESDKRLTAIENEAEHTIKIETVSEYDTDLILIIENETENTIKHENDVSDCEEQTEDCLNENEEVNCDEELTDGKRDNITTALNSKQKPHLKKVIKGKNRIRPEHACDKCDKIFMYPNKLRRHKLVHLKKEEKLRGFSCEKCGKTFNLPHKLKEHKLIHLRREEKANNPADVQPYVELNSCFTCKTKFETTALRNKHYEESETCQPRQFVCKVCNKSFKKNSILKHHEISHKEDRSFSCNDCSKTFKHLNSLKWHEKMHHKPKEEQLKHMCTFCGKGFALPCLLKLHEESHTKSGSYACEECGKIFTTKISFNGHKHERQTKNKNPKLSFLCSECGKLLGSKTNLEIHMRSHTGEKPFKCPHCPKAAASQITLDSHIRIHLDIRPYACDLCEKTFRQGAHLTAHKLMHSGAKPHKCDLCGNRFKSRGNLRLHMLIHTGDTPLTCPHCDERFADYKVRRTHIQNVHGVSTSKKEIVKVS